ncbi:Uncharacterised protein [Chryseobacterium nakagawai]|uniref:DUF4062 domain-containing protein n=1 Tax=Chryseobacterium nakagawai TaxID=1241982 RepID=A0AAD1DQK6_CHRNA|nr:hypothetical protein [Chryseobacterium nakagawai]AZA89944.1 hypothetical protein EG343_04545 [Chryseobacterium nakagawai]VEH21363.1 Uncharacterised protein [Chryseobacterium nakagawai]
MAKTITQFSLFLGSPSDLDPERVEINNIINELNISYASRNYINLNLIKWETHSAPGISHNYTQDLINKDIGNEYDIFIGMIWQKFGTKTEIANSGTEEEFLRAVKRFKNGENLQILFYFKTVPPLSLDQINTEELNRINNFKETLKENNILYWSFNTIEELKAHLRMHIPIRIDDLNSKAEYNISREVAKIENHLIEKNESFENKDDFGLLDYIFQLEDYLADSNIALTNISESTVKIGEDLQKKAEEIKRITKLPNTNKNTVLEYFKRTSKVINDYSDRIKLETPNFYDNFEEAINVGLKYLNLIDEDNIDDNYESLNGTYNSVSSLKENIPAAINGMLGFYNESAKLPNIQSDLNKSKRNLMKQLDELIFKLKKTFELTNEFQGQIEYKLTLYNKNKID